MISRERACSEAAIWWWREIICSSLAGTWLGFGVGVGVGVGLGLGVGLGVGLGGGLAIPKSLSEREFASRSAQVEGGRVTLTGPALGPDRRADLARDARVLVQELHLRHGE